MYYSSHTYNKTKRKEPSNKLSTSKVRLGGSSWKRKVSLSYRYVGCSESLPILRIYAPVVWQHVCVLVFGSEAQVYSLEECVVDAVNQHNKLATATDTWVECSDVDPHIVFIGALDLDPTVGHQWPGHPWGTGGVLMGGTGWMSVDNAVNQHNKLAAATDTWVEHSCRSSHYL